MSIQNLLLLLDAAGYDVVSTLLSMLWQSTILFAAAGALAFFLRRKKETIRHAVWLAALLALPLLPMLSRGVFPLIASRTEIAVIPDYAGPRETPFPQARLNQPSDTQQSDAPARSGKAISPPITAASGISHRTVSFADYPWALALFTYLLVVAGFLGWMLIMRLRIHSWVVRGAAVDCARTMEAFRTAEQFLGLDREYMVIEHSGIPAPLTCRILRPVVILPAGFAEGLSDSELRAVALHELAHIKRRDTLAFNGVVFLRALFFFQPLVWYAARQVSWLAEVACDSAALDHEGNPASYANLLTRIAFRLPDRALSTEMAAGILISNSAFFRRVREILSDRRERVRTLSRRALTGIAGAGVISLLIAAAFPLGGKVNTSLAAVRTDDTSLSRVSAMVDKLDQATGDAVPLPEKTREAYTVPFVRSGEITVDGDTSEWKTVGAAPASLTKASKRSMSFVRRMQPGTPGELSATLRCSADDDYLYIAVDVIDDEKVFANEFFTDPWSSDFLEILFFGDKKTDFSGQLWITLDSDGSVIVTGRDPISNERYPYLWESLGTRAAIGRTGSGYTVEAAVPLSVLEWLGWSGDRFRGMNVRVYDTDNEARQYLVEWSDVNGAGWRTLAFPSRGKSSGPMHIPFLAKDYDKIRETLTFISQGDWREAEGALRSARNAPWVNPLRGMVYLGMKKNREADREFHAALEKTSAPSIRNWLTAFKRPPIPVKYLSNPRRIKQSVSQITIREPWYESLMPFGTRHALDKKIKNAPTREKREAIAKLETVWRKYRRHDLTVLRCADMILKAGRNVTVIGGVSEYAVTQGGNTMVYVGIAEYAAVAPKASKEFLTLAGSVEKMGGSRMMIDFASLLAKAQTDAEIRGVMKYLEIMDRYSADMNSGAVSFLDPVGDLEKKMNAAKTGEKRKAIAEILDLLKSHRQYLPAMEIADDILDADRNIPILSKLAEYAIVQGSNTLTYMELAGYAAKAPLADKEFLQIAELIRTQKIALGAFELASRAAEAKTDAELQNVRIQIEAKGEVPAAVR